MFLLPPQNATNFKFSHAYERRPMLRDDLAKVDPVKAAGMVAGLLVDPSFHANNLRIEFLVHLLLGFARGPSDPTKKRMNEWLNSDLVAIGLTMFEDPVEDLFVANVMALEGNFRVFEGRWESNSFYLQLILDVIGTLPRNDDSDTLHRQIAAILRLSDAIAERMGIPRNSTGHGVDKGEIGLPTMKELRKLREAIAFTDDEVRELGLSPADVRPFAFEPRQRERIREQEFCDTDLERQPIVRYKGRWYVLLPNAIGVAVRHHVFNWIRERSYGPSFNENFSSAYCNFFAETPIMGSEMPHPGLISRSYVSHRTVLGFGKEVDTGRYLQVLAIVDSVEPYEAYGLGGIEPENNELTEFVNLEIAKARNQFRELEGFVEGLTLLVGCGYGRGLTLAAQTEVEDWSIEIISAPDLQTLGWLPHEPRLNLWKLVRYERILRENGITIHRCNGLLNHYAWWLSTDCRMFTSDIDLLVDPVQLVYPTDCIEVVRTAVSQGWDVQSLPFIDGSLRRVRRTTADSYFEDESKRPLYACGNSAEGSKLMGACVGERVWWISADHTESKCSREFVFQVWHAVYNWSDRLFASLERFLSGLDPSTMQIVLDFNETSNEFPDPTPPEELTASLSFQIDSTEGLIRIVLSDAFLGGFRIATNIAERTILKSICTAVLERAGSESTLSSADEIVDVVVGNDDARYFHVYEAHGFREKIHAFDKPRFLLLSPADEARTNFGLGWFGLKKKESKRFESKEESVKYLNNLVDRIWKRLREKLRMLNREYVIEQGLRFIEGAQAEKTRWERTLRAQLALRDELQGTQVTALSMVAEFITSDLSLRIVVEMAAQECSLDGGRKCGDIDFSQFMADAFCMFQFGGWSDAIDRGVMDPLIEVTPCGNIRSSVGFPYDVAENLAKAIHVRRLDGEVAKYADNYKPFEAVPSVDGLFPSEYIKAFEDEFGLPIDGLRGTRDALEDFALEQKKCVFVAKEDEILDFCDQSTFSSRDLGRIVLEKFSIWSRGKWDETPPGFFNRDWYPWRFHRRLSLVARPLVRLENTENPQYVVSPGLFGFAAVHTMYKYYEGEVDPIICESSRMREWISARRQARSHDFVVRVQQIMLDHGFVTRIEQSIKSVLEEKLDKNYGDIDVLAWRPDASDVWVIECKDLQLAMTPYEMAEQLRRFGGQELSNGKKDELLKHIERCNILRKKSGRLASRLNLGSKQADIQGVVCFSKIVPMQFVSERFPDMQFLTIDDLKLLTYPK